MPAPRSAGCASCRAHCGGGGRPGRGRQRWLSGRRSRWCSSPATRPRASGACLDSVRWADEIVVVDQHSHDETAAICREYGARVIERDMVAGFGEQKGFAVAQATRPWILSLDADEEVTPALRRAIEAAVAAPGDCVGLPRAAADVVPGPLHPPLRLVPEPRPPPLSPRPRRLQRRAGPRGGRRRRPGGRSRRGSAAPQLRLAGRPRAQAAPVHGLRRPHAAPPRGAPGSARRRVGARLQARRPLRAQVRRPAGVPRGLARLRAECDGRPGHVRQRRAAGGADRLARGAGGRRRRAGGAAHDSPARQLRRDGGGRRGEPARPRRVPRPPPPARDRLGDRRGAGGRAAAPAPRSRERRLTAAGAAVDAAHDGGGARAVAPIARPRAGRARARPRQSWRPLRRPGRAEPRRPARLARPHRRARPAARSAADPPRLRRRRQLDGDRRPAGAAPVPQS